MSTTSSTAPPSATTSAGSGSASSPTSNPLLFFVALGFGVVFTNLWIIVGVKYCFRYNQRNRQRAMMLENGEAIDLANMHRPHRRRKEKKLMTMDEVNERFPLTKYKLWRATRENEGLPGAGGIEAPSSRPGSIKNEEATVTAAAAVTRPSMDQRHFSVMPPAEALAIARLDHLLAANEELPGDIPSSPESAVTAHQDTSSSASPSHAPTDITSAHHDTTTTTNTTVTPPTTTEQATPRVSMDDLNSPHTLERVETAPEFPDTPQPPATAHTTSTDADAEAATKTEAGDTPRPSTSRLPPLPTVEDASNSDDEDDPIRGATAPAIDPTTNPGDTCAICIDTLEEDDDVRGLTCGHAFHAACLDPWLTSRRACCPLCKADYYIPKPRVPMSEGGNGEGDLATGPGTSVGMVLAASGDGRGRRPTAFTTHPLALSPMSRHTRSRASRAHAMAMRRNANATANSGSRWWGFGRRDAPPTNGTDGAPPPEESGNGNASRLTSYGRWFYGVNGHTGPANPNGPRTTADGQPDGVGNGPSGRSDSIPSRFNQMRASISDNARVSAHHRQLRNNMRRDLETQEREQRRASRNQLREAQQAQRAAAASAAAAEGTQDVERSGWRSRLPSVTMPRLAITRTGRGRTDAAADAQPPASATTEESPVTPRQLEAGRGTVTASA